MKAFFVHNVLKDLENRNIIQSVFRAVPNYLLL